MITKNNISEYNNLRINKSQNTADAYAQNVISELNLSTPRERGAVWEEFKQLMNSEKESAKKADKKAKRESRKGKASIKKICLELLNCSLSASEKSFVSDITKKRKLTEKQEKWLRDIAKSNSVEIVGNIESRVSKIVAYDCEHGDLGSLGYTHGSIVTCPNCGKKAEVW